MTPNHYLRLERTRVFRGAHKNRCHRPDLLIPSVSRSTAAPVKRAISGVTIGSTSRKKAVDHSMTISHRLSPMIFNGKLAYQARNAKVWPRAAIVTLSRNRTVGMQNLSRQRHVSPRSAGYVRRCPSQQVEIPARYHDTAMPHVLLDAPQVHTLGQPKTEVPCK